MTYRILNKGLNIIVALVFTVVAVVLAFEVDDARFLIYLSVVICLALVGVSYVCLSGRVRFNLLSDIGFVYCIIVSIYTIVPGISFLVFDLSNLRGFTWQTLINLQATNSSIGHHMLRHVLFLSMFILSYVVFYPKNALKKSELQAKERLLYLSTPWIDRFVIFSISMVFAILVVVVLSSSDVSSYVDHYTRFNHLSYSQKKLMSVLLRVKSGLILCVFPIMFLRFQRYKFVIGVLSISLLVFEVVYSSGSRIEAFFLVLYILCLYVLLVRGFGLLRITLIGASIILLFSFLEMLRSSEFHFSDVTANLADKSFSPAAEFCSVFSTGYHLYEERNADQLAGVEWPMFFNDFIMLVMPNDFTRYNPQYWYASIFYPDSVVPPQTNGPISDSALWGGEFDLVCRGLLNGAIFSWIVRVFLANLSKWWSYLIYAYCYSTSVMVVKYSVFYHLNPLFKTVLPAILILQVYLRSAKLNPEKQKI